MKFTPYIFVSSVFSRLGLITDSKYIKQYLHQAKIILEKLRSMGWSDTEILQMLDYTCTGIIKNNLPKSFRYFCGIMYSFCSNYVEQPESVVPESKYKNWINNEIERLCKEDLV